MNFDELFSSLTPRLRQLAQKFHRYCALVDEGDLFDEMSLTLWEKWQAGELRGKTESYIVQACYFHLRNYLRNVQDKGKFVSMEQPLDVAGGDVPHPLAELLSDDSQNLSDYVEGKALYEKIMNNGLSRREKDIIGYLYDGFTVREIGQKLNISHAMVIKYKKSICRKVTRRYGYLL